MKGRPRAALLFCGRRLNPDWRHPMAPGAVARGEAAPFQEAVLCLRAGAVPAVPCDAARKAVRRFRRVRSGEAVDARPVCSRRHRAPWRRPCLEVAVPATGRSKCPSKSGKTREGASGLVRELRCWREQTIGERLTRRISPIACRFLWAEIGGRYRLVLATPSGEASSPDSIWAIRWQCPDCRTRCRPPAACRRSRRAAPAGGCGPASRFRSRQNWRRRRGGQCGWVQAPWPPSRPC